MDEETAAARADLEIKEAKEHYFDTHRVEMSEPCLVRPPAEPVRLFLPLSWQELGQS
jgi:hypothetical protein